MATSLIDLIDRVNADDLPTNEFSIEDHDPMVILGKLNEVIAYLETLNETITESDTKATEALENARQAIADATEALSVANGIDAKATQALENAVEAVSTANTALSSASTALSSANSALSTANSALSTANSALSTANGADAKADEAITTAEGADTKADEAIETANGIDGKATQALTNSQTAITTANEAKEIAEEALEQVVTESGTKVYVGGILQSTFNADTKADLTRVQSLESDVGQAETDIDNLESAVSQAETDIDNLESVNNTQNGRLDTLETMTDDISEELETKATITQLITGLNTKQPIGNYTTFSSFVNHGNGHYTITLTDGTNNLIIKFGMCTGTGEQTFTYPLAFPNNLLTLVTGPDANTTSSAAKTWEHTMFYNATTTKFQWYGSDGYRFRYLAIGN